MIPKSWPLPLSLMFVIAAAFALPNASFAQVKVISSGGFAAALQDLLPELQKSTGITVTIGRGASQGTGPNTMAPSFGEMCLLTW